MVSYSKKILTFFVLLQLAVAYGASGQQTGGTYDILQEPRSNLIPYHSRAAALENIPDSSSWVLREYEPWEHEEAEDHSLWTTRYKIPRQWGGRSVIFRVEGVPSPFMLEVNNETAGYAQSGIGRTEFDITSMLKDDYNTIAVRIYKNAATNKSEDHRQHNDLRFRDAFMLAQPRIRVRDITASTLVEPDGRGILSMGVIMASAMRNPYEYTVHYELIDREGKVASSGSREFTTSWFSEDTLRFATTLPGVKPWNHETPNLYTLVVRSFHEGRNVEFVTAKIGFRNISYSNGSVLLNGRQVKLAPSEAAYLSNERRS